MRWFWYAHTLSNSIHWCYFLNNDDMDTWFCKGMGWRMHGWAIVPLWGAGTLPGGFGSHVLPPLNQWIQVLHFKYGKNTVRTSRSSLSLPPSCGCDPSRRSSPETPCPETCPSWSRGGTITRLLLPWSQASYHFERHISFQLEASYFHPQRSWHRGFIGVDK